MNEINPLSVACPACGQPAGKPCTTPGTHIPRKAAAQQRAYVEFLKAEADRYRKALDALIAADDSGNWADLQTAWDLARQVAKETAAAQEVQRRG